MSGRDGIGIRRVRFDARWGTVDVVDVAPDLATPMGEMVIRFAAARLSRVAARALTTVHMIERSDAGLRVVSEAGQGQRLSHLLDALESGEAIVPDEALLELAGMIVTAVGWLHELPGEICHGALTPSHIVLRTNGQLLLTDGVFGEAIARRRHSRERLWREFGVATPPCAGERVLDQQDDTTSMAAVILAIMSRRPLSEDEYPHAVADSIMAATARLPEWGLALRAWLQQALHLRPSFKSSVAAVAAFAGVMQSSPRRGDAGRALVATVFPPVISS